jgi:hypothetical protein
MAKMPSVFQIEALDYKEKLLERPPLSGLFFSRKCRVKKCFFKPVEKTPPFLQWLEKQSLRLKRSRARRLFS